MFDSRLPHHAELALWESTGSTSRTRWVRFPRSAPCPGGGMAYATVSETGPSGYEGSSPSLDTSSYLEHQIKKHATVAELAYAAG